MLCVRGGLGEIPASIYIYIRTVFFPPIPPPANSVVSPVPGIRIVDFLNAVVL